MDKNQNQKYQCPKISCLLERRSLFRKFDPNLVSQQCGGMVLLKRMEERGLISLTNPPSEHKPVTWLELYRKEEDSAIFPVLAAWATSELIESVELKNRSVDDLVDFCQKYPTAKTFHVASSSKTPPSPQTSLIIDSSVRLPKSPPRST